MNESTARDIAGYMGQLSAAVLACISLPSVAEAQSGTAEPTEEIIVTSSIIAQPRRQIGTAVSGIDFEEIELRGYTDLSDVLRTQTGIGVSNTGGQGKSTSVRIRGEETYRTTLMIDGVKALDPSAPQVSPDFDSLLTTSDLQRVEVLRGPQGFMYGADAGGVVNVITKRGADELGGRVGVEAGDYSTRKLDAAVSGGSDGGDYFLSVVDFETDGFNSRTDDTVLRDDDGAENTTLHAKLGLNVADDVRLQLVARDIDAESQYDNCGFPTVHDCVGTTKQTTYKLSADVSGDLFSNSFGYSDIDIAHDNFTAGVSAFATEGALSRFEYTGSYKPSDALALVYGVDLQEEELTDTDGTLSRDQDGYYVEYQGAFDDAFFLALGARYDDNEDFGTHTSSRLSVAYVQDLSSERSLKYRASAGTGFRAPSMYELAYNRGPFAFPPASLNPNLTEETSRGYDVGIEYNAANGLHFEATYFDQEIEDAIEFDLVGFSGYLQTQGTSTSSGVEVAADIPVGERWQLLANWTYNDTEDSAGVQRVRRPKNLGNLGVAYRTDDERLRLLANYRIS
ncbi:MAG TPA: TonB-dependent receptor, partial [Gammaproteobacteria bacterium]|nr:TonB-dependent receptor [Gammaproteobacteria bacterium]